MKRTHTRQPKPGNLMKLQLISLFVLLAFFSKTVGQTNDSIQRHKDKTKKGWNFGALPSVAFDSDLGFQYGILTNIYNYGDGSVYPRYKHSIYLEWARTTKGTGKNQLLYDSEYLIPHIRLTAEVNYLTDKALDFYGFNGYNAFYDPELATPGSPTYVSKMYYRLERKLIRIKFDFQGNITDKRLRWLVGYTLFNVKIKSVDIEALNKGKNQNDLLPDTSLLYDKYVEWGIIPQNQKNGGITNLLKFGIIYDTRDNEPNPMKGIWTEALILTSPSFLGNNFSYSKFVINHRQYFTIRKDVLNLAFRISYQDKIGGKMPFYMLPFIFSSNQIRDGLGGAKTLRGIARNRVMGEGVLFGNLELRWKFFRRVMFNQNFYLALAPFIDLGTVTRKYDFQTSSIEAQKYLNQGGAEKFHQSYGIGIYGAMNQNFVAAINYGIAANKNDGTNGLYIGLDFLF